MSKKCKTCDGTGIMEKLLPFNPRYPKATELRRVKCDKCRDSKKKSEDSDVDISESIVVNRHMEYERYRQEFRDMERAFMREREALRHQIYMLNEELRRRPHKAVARPDFFDEPRRGVKDGY